jgi:hypothetical protein
MKAYQIVGLLVIACLVSGCGTTLQTRKAPTPSGFLGDYTQLNPGAEGESHLVYVNPKVNFAEYKKVILDPVKVYAGKDSKIAKVPREDLQKLVNYFDAALREQLKTEYTLVDKPGPGVMRLQVAITEAGKSIVALDIMSSLTPPGIAMNGLKQLATGTAAMTGSVGGECQALDSVSNERLFAAVDARAGHKYTGKFDKLNKWRAAQGAFDYWAERIVNRLREESGKGAK